MRWPFTRQACAAVVLSLSLASAPACAFRVPPNATPQQIEQIRLHELQRVAQVTERIGVLVLSLQQAEIGFYRVGRVPESTHMAIQTYLKLSSDFVVAALETAKDQTKPVQTRRDGILAALKLVDGFQTEIVDKLPDEAVRTRLGSIVLAVQGLLLTLQLVT